MELRVASKDACLSLPLSHRSPLRFQLPSPPPHSLHLSPSWRPSIKRTISLSRNPHQKRVSQIMAMSARNNDEFIAESPAKALRRILEMPGVHQGPACFDALSAKLVERAGFLYCFTSGMCLSLSLFNVLILFNWINFRRGEKLLNWWESDHKC